MAVVAPGLGTGSRDLQTDRLRPNGLGAEVLRKQGGNVLGGLGQRQTFEEVGEVGAWFQPVGFGRFDQRVEGGARPGPAGGETEQPVLAIMPSWA